MYGLPGDSLHGLTDALRGGGEIAWRHVRREEAAACARVTHFRHGRGGRPPFRASNDGEVQMEISCAFPTALDSPDHIALAERLGYDRAWL